MTSWMLDLWFDLQLTYIYFWSTYDFVQRMTRYDCQRLDENDFLAIFEPTSISFLVNFMWPESEFLMAELSGRQASCFILPPPRFPDDNFWPPSQLSSRILAGHGHRKKCIIFRPRATPGWGRGAPQTPQSPPPLKKNIYLCVRFRTPGNFFFEF